MNEIVVMNCVKSVVIHMNEIVCDELWAKVVGLLAVCKASGSFQKL